MPLKKRIAVVGGGAAGFFGAINCAEADPAADVSIYEASAHVLAKVRVSGGGRCNVTHACFDPRELVTRYPRGGRELLGALHRFGPRETIAWFAERGVELKTEEDGRMFPVTDDSGTIVSCLQRAAARAGVRVIMRCGVKEIARASGGAFALVLATGETVPADFVLLASGGGQDSAGARMARSLGHAIEPQVPSLFTFHIDDARLRGLEGVSVPLAEVGVRDTKLRQSGAMLVTHWGLSGPAILRLSAWGARELHAADYRVSIAVNWVAPRTRAQVLAELAAMRTTHPRRQLVSGNPFAVPGRLWERLIESSGIGSTTVWTAASNAVLESLAAQLVAGEFSVSGKSMNKEEFVTCGGVRLREVDFRTMESRVCAGLFFAGEILDVDGVTGGFNFQAAWTTSRLAAEAIAAR